MSEVPTPVSESTAIEIVRTEGSTRSAKAIGTLTAGNLVAYSQTTSGASLAVPSAIGLAGGQVGVALYTATSGQRVITIKGKVRALWDGTGTLNFGTPIGISTTQSGYFEPSAATSGAAVIGFAIGGGAGSAITTSGLVAVSLL